MGRLDKQSRSEKPTSLYAMLTQDNTPKAKEAKRRRSSERRKIRRATREQLGNVSSKAKKSYELVGRAGVRQAQRYLIKRGYLKGTADGIYGPKTCQAVLSFQKDVGLSEDAVIGKKTLAALKKRGKTIRNTKEVAKRKKTREVSSRSASLRKYLKHPRWGRHVSKLMRSVENLESRKLALVSDVKRRKTLVIKKGRVQEVPFTPGKGTTPRKLRFAKYMNLASGPQVDASNTGASATVLGCVLDFGDTKHVHGVAPGRTYTKGCVGINTNYMYKLGRQLKSGATQAAWKGWKTKRPGKKNKYGFASRPGTAKRYRLAQSVPVLTV